MSKFVSIILIGLAGYYLIQKRYRFLNVIFRSPIFRQYFIRFIMNIPGLRKKMLNTVFSRPKSTIYQ
jgi:hypothetical protein